jgi:phosphate/sulfate permease
MGARSVVELPPFAPAVGANAVPTMRAAFFLGTFAALGAIARGGVSPRRSATT